MRTLIASAAVFAVLAAGPTAYAGSYVALGIGSGAKLTGDLAANYATTEDSSAGRLAIGERLGPLAIEASMFGTNLNSAAGEEMTAVSLGVDVKYHVGIVGGLEAYARAGLSRTRVIDRAASMTDSTLGGKGTSLGGGLQYSLRLPLGQFAVWADYNRQSLDLSGDGIALDGGANMFTLGVTIGL